MNTDKPKIVVICGPTGVGKTSAAIDVASAFNGEIINADSMQIYKYMDIGTAKPTPEEQARIPHHLIDIVEPDEHFDAAMFAKTAHKKIAELCKNNILPFVVGGTGFYIKSLTQGLFESRASDSDIRRELKAEAAEKGTGFLHAQLSQYDPEAANRLHPNDTFRIIRAIEIYKTTGKRISEHHQEHGFTDTRFHVLKIGLSIEREHLYDRINARTDAMMNAGFVEEVRGLLDRNYSEELKSMQSIGYRHIIELIRERVSYDEAVRTLKRDTRRYAKRQMTWFKADPDVIWAAPGQTEYVCSLVKQYLE
jgi:tRNA dimethylallyltransferase